MASGVRSATISNSSVIDRAVVVRGDRLMR